MELFKLRCCREDLADSLYKLFGCITNGALPLCCHVVLLSMPLVHQGIPLSWWIVWRGSLDLKVDGSVGMRGHKIYTGLRR